MPVGSNETDPIEDVRVAFRDLVLNPQLIADAHDFGEDRLLVRYFDYNMNWPVYALALTSDSAECADDVCRSHWRAVMYSVDGAQPYAAGPEHYWRVRGWIQRDPDRTAEHWAQQIPVTRLEADWTQCHSVDDVFEGLGENLNLDSDVELFLRNLRRGSAPRLLLHADEVEVTIRTLYDDASIRGAVVGNSGLVSWAVERAQLLEPCWREID